MFVRRLAWWWNAQVVGYFVVIHYRVIHAFYLYFVLF